MSVEQLPAFVQAAQRKRGLSFFRKATQRQSKTNLSTVKLLFRAAKANGLKVSGVTIGPDGTVSVMTTTEQQSNLNTSNPWDVELS